jgi:hypothetical protein
MWRSSKYFLITIALSGFVIQASARERCGCAVSQFREIEDFHDLIIQAGIIDEDDRRTEDQYAKENKNAKTGQVETVDTIKKRYAATGAINCGNGKVYGSAQLTLKDNLITTSAHALLDMDSCAVLAAPSDCVFVVYSHGKERQIKIDKKIKSGYDGKTCPQAMEDDWLVLKLSEHVDDVKPYQVDPKAVTKMHNGSDVVAVGRSKDFRTFTLVNGQRLYNFPKHVGNCKVKDTFEFPATRIYTNCDSSKFSSGGSLLSENSDSVTLLAIHQGSMETAEQANAAMVSGVPNRGEYSKAQRYSSYIPIAGAVYDSLIQEANSK